VNFGIVPLVFSNETNFDNIQQGDSLEIETCGLENGTITVRNVSSSTEIPVTFPLSGRDVELLRAGGALAYAKQSILKK
jgi:aconitate hydratase